MFGVDNNMRIELTLDSANNEKVRLPRINLNLLQAMIYKIMPDELSEFLHEKGYKYEKRKFKLFSYSWIRGKKKPAFDEKHIYFEAPLKLTISSPIAETLEGLANGSLTSQTIRLGNNELICSSVLVKNDAVETDSIILNTLSPITCFSTLYKADGKPYTVYHDPREDVFQQQIRENLKKKYALIHPDKKIPDTEIEIQPIGKPRQQIARFKEEDPRPIKGWWGKFRLKGSKEMLQVALDAGLGAKNSAGFGCISQIGSEGRK
jgi:CRISPR-associated endoribonuclease Cas6